MTKSSDLDRYLDDLGRRLVGPRRYRRELLTEMRTHLAQLFADESNADRAEIIRHFGQPNNLAAELNTVHRTKKHRQRRRSLIAIAVLATFGATLGLTTPTPSGLMGQSNSTPRGMQTPIAVTLNPATGAILVQQPLAEAIRR